MLTDPNRAPGARRRGRNGPVCQTTARGCPRVNCRSFEALRPLMEHGGLYPNLCKSCGSELTAFLGVESDLGANLTVVPPWRNGSALAFGSTIGHEQVDPLPHPRAYSEVHQSLTHAAVLIDCPNKPTMRLYVLMPGEKVAIPNGCIMTVFNLGIQPAVLLDLTNPARHQTNNRVQAQSGPAVAMGYEAGSLRVRLNQSYVNRQDGYGVTDPRTRAELALPVPSADPRMIAEALTSACGRRKLGLLGIKVRRPNMTILARRMGLKQEALDESLAELRKDDLSHPLVWYLFGQPRPAQSARRVAAKSAERCVAIVGGWGKVSRERIVPVLAGSNGAGFVCSERVPEPTVALAGRRPHPYATWFGPQQQREFYRNVREGALSAVHLATPPKVTGKLLRTLAAIAATTLVELVVADKPWWPDYEVARAAAGALAGSPVKFRFFDHYLYRGAVQGVLARGVARLLGGPIESIEIRLWEPAPYTSAAQGETGVLADLAVHGVSLARRLLPEARFSATRATAARHANSTDYETETFCSVELSATNGQGQIPIRISAAKYMPRALATKEMLITGPGGKLHFDLAGDWADLVHPAGADRIYPGGQHTIPTGYEVLVHKLAAGDAEVGLDLDEALSIQEVLHEARAHFPTALPVLAGREYPPLPDWCRQRRRRAA